MSFSLIIITILSIYSILATLFCLKFALAILKVQDSIENSLDIIDEKYGSISEILERPLFYDSPEIRRVLEDVSDTRDAILEIAGSLSNNFSPDEKNEQELDER